MQELLAANGVTQILYALNLGPNGSGFMDIGTYNNSGSVKWFTDQPYSQFWQATLRAYYLGKVSTPLCLRLWLERICDIRWKQDDELHGEQLHSSGLLQFVKQPACLADRHVPSSDELHSL